MTSKSLGLVLGAVLVFGASAPVAFAGTLNVVQDSTNAAYYSAIVKAADRLITLQSIDGAWDWNVTSNSAFVGDAINNCGPDGCFNITGVTAEGLLSAYAVTGKQPYLDAAKKAGDHIVSVIDAATTKSINAYNVLFLQKLSTVSGDASYATKAAEYFGILYSSPTTICATGCTDSAGIVAGQTAKRASQGFADPNGIVVWDLVPYVEYAKLVGDDTHAQEIADAIIAKANLLVNTDSNYDLGLASGLRAASLVGDSANVATLASTITSVDASYGTVSDGKIQTTSYMVRAFKLTSDSRADASAAYILSGTIPTGGWTETDSTEYSEVDSEAITALVAMLPQVVQYYTIPDAMNVAVDGDTINIGAGTYELDSQMAISKQLTITGAGDSTVITKGATAWTNSTGSKGLAPIIGIRSNDKAVVLQDLKVTGAANIAMTPSGTDYGHGINVYASSNVTLNNVTSEANAAAGLVVNSSTVTINNFTTTNNGWGGINVDQKTIPLASLTVNGVSSHSGAGSAIWVDDITKEVSVVDTNNQYSFVDQGNVRTYNLKTLANPSLDLGAAVEGIATTTVVITMDSGDVEVVIPTGTAVTSTDTNWDGTINLPTVIDTTVQPTPNAGQTATVVGSIEVGFADVHLTFSKGVRLVFAGQAGNYVGWSQSGVFHPITAVCADDSQTTGDALPEDSECKINVGSDLVVWTKHFSTFTTYTQRFPSGGSGASSGSGGGGGGGSISAAIPAAPATPATPTVVAAAPATPATPAVPAQGQVLGAERYNFTMALSVGVRNNEVTELQKVLIAEGLLKIDAPTGYFGQLTREAVIAFQKSRGIAQAGVVGPLTRAELNKGAVVSAVAKTNLTAAQTDAIISLIESFSADAAVLAKVKAALGR